MPITLPPAPDGPETPEGYYGDFSDLIAVCGEIDLRNYSNLDGTDLETSGPFAGNRAFDYDRIQDAMDKADAQVNAYLSDNRAVSPAATTDSAFDLLRQAWALIAVVILYQARGSEVDTDDAGNTAYKSNKWAKDARVLMERFALGKRLAAFSTSLAFSGPDVPGAYPCG